MGLLRNFLNPDSRFTDNPDFQAEVKRITELRAICSRMWNGNNPVYISVSDSWKQNNQTEDQDDYLKPYHSYIYLNIFWNDFYSSAYLDAYWKAFHARNNANRYIIGESAYAKLEANLKQAEDQLIRVLFRTRTDYNRFLKLTYNRGYLDEVVEHLSPYSPNRSDDYVFHFPVYLRGSIFTDKKDGYLARKTLVNQFSYR